MNNSINHWTPITIRFLIVWGVLLCTKLLFLAGNFSYLNIGAYDFIYTIPFDLSTIALYSLPFLFFYLLPINKSLQRVKESLVNFLFYLTITTIILLNMWDVAYFSYSQRLTTFDTFSFLIQSPDKGLIHYFILDYWWISMASILLITAFILLDKRLAKNQKKPILPLKFQLLHLIFGSLLFFSIGRWSFGPKPLGVLDANIYTNAENVPFVLNTAFVTLKTIQSEQLPNKSLISLEESKKYFNPIKEVSPSPKKRIKKNVVIIILESFGDKMIHQTINGIRITPFTDSLLSQSCYYENGIANGKQSIESLPAIFASIPHLMNTPYILSSYCNNKLKALPSILKSNGYSTAFFHGAKNGSMRFDSFSKKLGFDRYYGKDEYPNQNHDDGLWGIPDSYFNPWTVQEISKIKQPFFVSLFTISSHHPYKIPKIYSKKITDNLSKEQLSFHYADESLRDFFNKAKKESWYKNTVFVICADHIPQQLDKYSKTIFDKFHIPIAFYTPDKSIPIEKKSSYFQQIDIAPYMLNYLTIKTKYYAFGNDATISEGVIYLNGNYHLLSNHTDINFNESKNEAVYLDNRTHQLFKINTKTINQTYSKLLLRLKSIIGRYRNDLITNQTIVK
jgi:phosphoglycerol transferase MdoB-like AlkP superfamily enzyme